jgi:hypothetical protein
MPITSTVKCPHCEHDLDPAWLHEVAGTIVGAQRTQFKGRAKVVYKCGCGELFDARSLREHKCDLKPPRGTETKNPRYLATEEERARYLARNDG